MTTGSVVYDNTALQPQWTYNYVTGVTTYQADGAAGSYYSKTWNGTDYPVQKPQYEKIYWRDPYLGKLHVHKRRLDKPVRTKTDYHPYNSAITKRDGNVFVWDRSLYGSLDSRYQRTMFAQYGNLGYSTDSNSEWLANDTLALQGKLREAIAGSDFDLGVFLGESHQTLKLISENATRIYKAFKKVKKGDVVGASKALGVLPPKGGSHSKNVGSRWLELQYGWVPLVKDVHSAAEFLAKQLEFPLVRTYRVRRRKPLKLTTVAAGSVFNANAHGETRGQIIARLSEVDVAQLSGLTDPASVAWELMPWSFVFDWFVPIGEYLSARSLASSLTGEFVVTTTRRAESHLEALVMVNSPPVKESLIQKGIMNSFSLTVTRTVSTNLAVPFPNVKPLSKVASWQHCANSIALLTQVAKYH